MSQKYVSKVKHWPSGWLKCSILSTTAFHLPYWAWTCTCIYVNHIYGRNHRCFYPKIGGSGGAEGAHGGG